MKIDIYVVYLCKNKTSHYIVVEFRKIPINISIGRHMTNMYL